MQKCTYDLDGGCTARAEAIVVSKTGSPISVPTCWAHAAYLVALNDEEGWPAEHHVVPVS